jgi:hypothetical protein
MSFSWEVSTPSPKANGKWFEEPWFGREAERLCDGKEWLLGRNVLHTIQLDKYFIITFILYLSDA